MNIRLNEELKKSNIELAAFASAASHDLQLLAQRAGTNFDEQKRNLVELISALLDYARLVDFEDVLKTVRANLAEPIRDSGANIHCAPLPSVHADLDLRSILPLFDWRASGVLSSAITGSVLTPDRHVLFLGLSSDCMG